MPSIDNPTPTDEQIKAAVRERYAAAIGRSGQGCCGAASDCGSAASRPDTAERGYYSPEELSDLPADAVANSFGCGNPLSFAGVRSGDAVLDIGSGAGIDVLLASRVVGPAGKVIGLDFTPEMIARAADNAARAGAENVEFRLGDAEHMPLDDASVDWVISNCVINLAPDKRKVFSEVFRVLKPGGRVSISDIVTGELPAALRNDLGLWARCVAGAVEEEEYLKLMHDAGLIDVQVIARQRYDVASVRSMIESMLTGALEQRQMTALLDHNEDLLSSIWSAKIVATKPAA